VKDTDIQGTAPVYIFSHASCVQLFEYRFEPAQKYPIYMQEFLRSG